MNSKLYTGIVEHERFHPASHRLTYKLYMYALDLAELEALDQRFPLFGHNRLRPVSVYDRDYLGRQPMSIRRKVLEQVSAHVSTDDVDRIVLATSPRLLGYVFNPASFYFCFSRSGRLLVALTEVNNTFGEKHVYVLSDNLQVNGEFPARFQADKAFHVSPFNNMDGAYQFTFADIREKLDICIDLHRKGEHILRAHLQGDPLPLTPFNHMKTVLRHPIRPHLTISRIYREAFKLFFIRRLAFFSKPVPRSPMTIGRLPPTTIQRYCMTLILDHLAKAAHGRLRVTFPDSSTVDFGEQDHPGRAHMTINDYRFFSRVALGSDIGLGEAFMFDEWDTDDIPAVLCFFIRNRQKLKDGDFKEGLMVQALEKLRFFSRANTLTGSRRNIRRHYDLSNAFFQTFLDDSMAYSSAIFNHPGERLEAAQQNKYRTIIDKLQLGADDHLLEIGCGWGGFAIEAVRRTGCRITGITISRDQSHLARERVRQAGLQDRIHILFRDYRKMNGRFDKIVSIEMLEAVGHAYYGTFFRQLDRLLAPDGMVVIQTITIPDQRYDTYRKTHDWIQKHIFPGGLLPSLTVLTRAMTRHSSLMVDHVENIGSHYATTLARWHRRFKANQDQVTQLGFDRIFQRKWAYYLGSCEAGFRERVLGDLQLVLTREGNTRLAD
jgi:cyclopropane-fatty-acyl-phospholipid synthase